MTSDSLQQQVSILQARNDALTSQLAKLERTEQILNTVLEGTATTTGDDFFKTLVSQVALALGAKYVFLGKLSGEQSEQIKTLAYWNKGKLADNFEYDLLGSPCATVIDNKIQYYPQKTFALFPDDQPLVKQRIECYLGVPLFNSSGKSIGIIVVMHDQILEKVADVVPVIGIFAARAAAELERKQSEARAHEQQELAQALHEIGVAFSSSLELDVILDLLLEYVGRVVPYDSANVILVDNGHTRIVRARGYEKFGIHIDIDSQPPTYEIAQTPTWRNMIKTQKPTVIPDVTQHDDWRKPTYSTQMRSWASAPIIVNGEVVAFLSTNKLEPGFYTKEHGNRLAAFAASAALAWQNARSYTAATERAEALNATGNILRALNAASNIEEALPTLVNHLQSLTGAARISVARIVRDLNSLVFIGFQGDHQIQNPARPLYLTETAATEDIENGRSHLVPDITTELAYRAAQLLYASGIRSYISLPLIGRKNSLGALTLSWTSEHGYNEDQIPFLEQIADAVALGMERSNLYNAAHYRSQELNLLYQVISVAASGSNQEDILQTSCVEIATFLNIRHVTLSLLDVPLVPNMTNKVQATIGAQFINEGEINLLGKQMMFDPQGALLSELVLTKAPIVIDSLATIPLSSGMHKLAEVYNLVSAIIIPITLRQKIIGIIGIGTKEARSFQDSEIRLLQTVAEELGRVLEITSLYDQLRHHAADLEVRVVARTQELANANEQLQALDKMKSRFVSDVSHELRTPVTNLKLYLDLLDHKGEGSLHQYLPILQKQAERLSQLIQDILDLSRLELGRTKLAFEPLDLNELVQDIMVAHEPMAEASDLQLVFAADDTLPLVLGERNQLAQVVTNLLTNAINYSTNGVIQVQTAVSPPHVVDKMVSLEISDNGLGISPDDLPYLFDRFYRGQQIRQSTIPGTGLGLAIADEIVRIHNGRLEVESVEGEGSTFRVCLPLPTSTSNSVA